MYYILFGIQFELRFSDSIYKVSQSGSGTHNLVLTVHTLYLLSYLARRRDVLNGPLGSSDHEAQFIVR